MLENNQSKSFHRPHGKRIRLFYGLLALTGLFFIGRVGAQEGTKLLTTADYARADQALPWNATKLILNLQVTPHWIDKTNRFWYKSENPGGWEFLYVDPASTTKKPAFDHARLATALSLTTGSLYTAQRLPFDSFDASNADKAIEFDVNKKHWRCSLALYRCEDVGIATGEPSPAEVPSPDKRWIAFVREHNLYVRLVETKQEIQLTNDGTQYDDYATSPDMDQQGFTERIRGISPIGVVWSPDSRKILTYKLDQTKVRESYLIQSVVAGSIGAGRPILHAYKYAFPGDPNVPMAKFLIFDVATKTSVPLGIPQQPFVTGVMQNLSSVWWGKSGKDVYCVERERLSKVLKFSVTDARTGSTRVILEERGTTLIETIAQSGNDPLVPVLSGSGEAIWYSERDGWAHLYLYDVATGRLKNRITAGPWVVRQIKYIDEASRWLYFTASGCQSAGNPYQRFLYRIHLDGTGLQLLTPEDADHQIDVSSDGLYFVDTYSKVDMPPVSRVQSMDGKVVQELERADIHALLEKGFRAPEPFQAKAADGQTDIYGVIFRPSNFDPTKRYPVVDSIYPGPQRIQTPVSFFDPLETASQAQAVAELGFVVVTMDGRGTPLRSKAFYDYSYANLGDAGGLEDHIAAIKYLVDT